jgi:Rad3-related DNA helicase
MALKQAFGRLIRSVDDNGAFVLFDKRINKLELQAFPSDVEILKLTLDEAVEIITKR